MQQLQFIWISLLTYTWNSLHDVSKQWFRNNVSKQFSDLSVELFSMCLLTLHHSNISALDAVLLRLDATCIIYSQNNLAVTCTVIILKDISLSKLHQKLLTFLPLLYYILLFLHQLYYPPLDRFNLYNDFSMDGFYSL